MADGPEDRVIDSIWSRRSERDLLTFKAGEVEVSVTDAIVWFPFLVLVVTGWIATVVFLPPAQAARFIDLTLGWLALLGGELSGSVLVSLVATLIGLAVALFVYTRVYGVVIGRMLEYTSK